MLQFLSKRMICSMLLIWGMSAWVSCSKQIPYQATGIKIGEVTDTSAIVWTRLTQNQERIGSDAPMPIVEYKYNTTDAWSDSVRGRPDAEPRVIFPDGHDVNSIEGACPGMEGQVRLFYKAADEREWRQTEWTPVDPNRDFTQQIVLENLKPNSKYYLQVETQADDYGQVIKGEFRTAPAPEQPAKITFTVSTGQAYNDMDLPDQGFKIYPAMLRLNPNFFVHTGDIVYYDRLAKNSALARWHWQRTYSLPTNVEFHKNIPSYFIKDDHDTWMNDCWPGMQTRYMGDFTFEQGQSIFLEQVPMRQPTYRTFRWGKDLQIWLVEGRDYRSPNTMPGGPEKTIWGQKQIQWFKETVQQSDATFRVLISPTPIIGPDRESKRDNHSNAAFQTEGEELRSFIASQKNMAVICGDRHWQYVSVDRKTGVKEYSCGPASNEHAGGWTNDMQRAEHRYLNVTGGFLAVTVEREGGTPLFSVAHYDVDGEVLHLDQWRAK